MTTSSAIHSNALNFLSHVQTGVDPRTGQYTCSLSLPDLNANDLAGPQLPLSLGYSPLNTVDSGFGTGWTLQLSQYDTGSMILSLSTGETFKVTSTSSGSNELLMKEKKIDSFHLHDLGGGHYRVVHKSGLVEELSTSGSGNLALPHTLYSPEGRHITLSYVPFGSGGRLLKSISEADGNLLLDITRQTGSVLVRLHPNMPYEVLFQMVLEGSQAHVAQIKLPLGGSWRFTYEPGGQLLKRIEGPLGGFETLTYDSTPHLFPGDDNRRLPRVARHLHEPGGGQPAIDTRYEYSTRNFLGRDAPGLSWEDNGLDNLYKVLADYLYDSTEQLWDPAEDKPLRSIKRTFNRFHLVTDETTEQGDCVKRVLTEYYAEAGKPFDQQPPQCQLPKTVTTTWYRKSDPARLRVETVTSEFDVHGNPTLRVQANGVSETSSYYPAAGDDGCPPDPHGFVCYLKDKTVSPARAEFGDAPVLRTHHRYISLPPVSAGNYHWVALEQEDVVHVNGGNAELQSTHHRYCNLPADSLQHGRLEKTEVVLNGKHTYTNFSYLKTSATRSDETVLRTVEVISTSFDQVKKTITREQSLLNGQPLLERDDNDVEIAYRYDALGRVTEETVAPGSEDYAATRRYEYLLVERPDQQASQTATDVKGVKTRTLLDGLQRVVREERQDVDGDPIARPFRPTSQARYNAFGQLSESDEIDWLYENDPAPVTRELVLTSTYTYDDWGEQDSVTTADGVTEHREIRNSMTTPIRLEIHEWRDGMGKIVARQNLFGKADSVTRFDLAGNPVSEKTFFYDGLGRTHHELDELKQFRYYEYDAFGRMTLSGLPDGAKVERRYAEHSAEDLPVWIGVNGVTLGEQSFDGLGRLTSLTVGPRCENYEYDGGFPQASKRITPSGNAISYTYTPSLTHRPTGMTAPDEANTYTYDQRNAQLSLAENQQGRREFDYDSSGHLGAERWVEDGETWATSYRHSLAGRRLSSTDANGLNTSNVYDSFGRLEQMDQGDVRLCYTYDKYSRPYLTTCEDRAAIITLTTILAFDDWGQETGRTLKVTGQPDRTIDQSFRLDGRLQTRHQQSAGQSLLLETFRYDNRGRLDLHQCEGSELPADRYGNLIVEQAFTYDALDNLCKVTTRFADGSDDLCVRTFAPDDPCRLTHLTHSHADYPLSLDLEYTTDGHLLYDENGQRLDYDTQGRLLQVSAPDGTVVSRYHYDAHNQLSGVSQGNKPQTRRFYEGDNLGCTVQDATRISYLHDGDCPLSQQQPGTPEETLLLLTNASHSVIAESQQQALRTTCYDAYGQRSNDTLQCDLAFNGELRDQQTGWYLLGKGYRAYNPWLMCFHSPDSLSPFGAGGLNPWMYCAGDPVNFHDPSGHMPSWLSWTLLGVTAAVLIGTGIGFGAAGLLLGAKGATSALVTGFAAASLPTKVAFTASAVGATLRSASLITPDKQAKKVLGGIATAFEVIAIVSAFWSLLAAKGSITAMFGMKGKAGVSSADDAVTVASGSGSSSGGSISRAPVKTPPKSIPKATTSVGTQTSGTPLQSPRGSVSSTGSISSSASSSANPSVVPSSPPPATHTSGGNVVLKPNPDEFNQLFANNFERVSNLQTSISIRNTAPVSPTEPPPTVYLTGGRRPPTMNN